VKTLQELRDARAKALADARALLYEGDEARGDVSDEDKAAADALIQSAADLKVEIDARVADEQRLATLGTELAAQDVVEARQTVAIQTTRAIEHPEGNSQVPANAYRYGALRSFKGQDADLHAYRFGVWCAAAAGLEWAQNRSQNMGLVHTRAQSETVNTAGGFLVPPEFDQTIIDLRDEYGVVRNAFKLAPMVSDTKSVPRRTGGLTAYFVGESEEGTQSDKSWDQVNLTARKLMCLTKYSSELSEDAIINIGDDLASEIAYAFTVKEDQCGFIGDGSTTYGGMQGVIKRLESVNGVDEGGGTELATGNLLSEVTLTDYNGMVARIPAYAEAQAVWYTSKWVFGNSMEALASAAGGNTWTALADGHRTRTFLGFPVVIASGVFPTADANSQTIALLGDLRMAAMFGTRRGTEIAFSNSALNAFEKDEIVIRGVERFDINVHDVGTATVAGPVVNLLTAAS